MENNTYKYIDVLQKIVHSYNNTSHQSLGGSTPASVIKDNEDEIRYIQYLVRQKRSKNVMTKKEIKMTTSKKSSKKKKRIFYKFKVGDLVRISHLKRVFEKGYQEKWTLEYFKISKRFKREDKDIYKITDILGDPIKGTFYRNELQKIEQSDNDLYKVEKIIKKRKIARNETEVLVKWVGWPSKFNSWVNENTLKDV